MKNNNLVSLAFMSGYLKKTAEDMSDVYSRQANQLSPTKTSSVISKQLRPAIQYTHDEGPNLTENKVTLKKSPHMSQGNVIQKEAYYPDIPAILTILGLAGAAGAGARSIKEHEGGQGSLTAKKVGTVAAAALPAAATIAGEMARRRFKKLNMPFTLVETLALGFPTIAAAAGWQAHKLLTDK